MPLTFSAQLISSLLGWLEPHYLGWTQLPDSSLSLDFATDLMRSKSDLILENALLRQQLLTLRVQRQVKKPRFTRTERCSLLLLASRLHNWKHLLLILKPATLLRWHRHGFRLFWRLKSRARRGRPCLSQDLVALIRQMARENLLWGAERIQGELLNLGLHAAKRTIQKYMRQVRPPRPPNQNWSTFLKNHATDIWACDFLPVVDLFFRQVSILFLIELGSRRVVHFGVTRTPTEACVAQQLREATPYGAGPKYLIRDNDCKFGTVFDRVAKGTGIEVLKIPYRAPQANAVCERFLGSVRRECLDHWLIFGERQLSRVIQEYVGYFNRARPHQGIGQKVPVGSRSEGAEPATGKIIAFPILGGLHHDYRRAA